MANRRERKKAASMASAGASVSQIVRATGVTRQSAQNRVERARATPQPATAPVASNPSPVTAPTAMRQRDARSLTQSLRIAGSDGNINKRELKRATRQFGKTSVQAVKRLDQLNAGIKERGNALQIGLGSGAVNYIMKDLPAGQAGMNQFSTKWGQSGIFGTGRIGSALSRYTNASFGPTGLLGRSQRARAQSAAGLIPLQGPAYQIDARGNYSPKVSNPAFSNPVPRIKPTNQTTEPVDSPGAGGGGGGGGGGGLPPEMPPEILPPDLGSGMMSGGGLGAAGANKLGRAKSRLRKLGIYGRGTSLLGRGLQYGNTLNA